jgi:hypothetical protein
MPVLKDAFHHGGVGGENLREDIRWKYGVPLK